jgi:hypothetical protein
MEILIQHNFTSGIGDFFIAMSEYMTYCKKLKNIGYKINLYINLSQNKYLNYPSKFIKQILDKETLDFFEEITEEYQSINNYKDYRYWKSGHNPDSPGLHRWDIFVNNHIPQDLIFQPLSTLLLQVSFPINVDNIIYPKFNDEIEEKAKIFIKQYNNYNFFQVRLEDGKENINHNLFIDKIQKIINNNEIFHIGTNSKSIFYLFQNHPKTTFYPFKNFDLIDNQHNIGHRLKFTNLNDNIILEERLIETIVEMTSIKHANNIYYYSDYIWPSSFLFYSLLVSKKKAINIKEEI